MRAILHIGTEKTGTTSFQRFCYKNRKALKEKGVLYPTQLGGENHRLLSSYAMDPDAQDNFALTQNLETEAARQEFQDRVAAQIAEQVDAAADADICLFSSEHLHSRLNTVEEIQRLKTLLEPLFSSIEVYVHLRPQVDVVVSLASTQARVGGATRQQFFENPSPKRVYYNYNKLVDLWETVFGIENVHCLAFKRTPDFQGYFFDRMEIDVSDLPKPKRVNEAIDVRVMAMINALTESGSAQRIDHRVIDMLPVEQKAQPSAEMAQRIHSRFVTSNQALIARRDDLSPGDLQPNFSKYPDEGNLEILDQPCAFSAVLAQLVAHYNTVLDAK